MVASFTRIQSPLNLLLNQDNQQVNIKNEHVDHNHHVLLILQEIKERKEQRTNKVRRNGEKEIIK
jgi:hypothetical protein